MNGEIRINDAAQLPVVLNDLRTILQMRQLDVAEASGYYKAQISTWFSGRTSMDTSSLIRVANALGYDLALIPALIPQEDA